MLKYSIWLPAPTGKSNVSSQSVLRDEREIRRRREWLIDKWSERVSADELYCAFESLEVFGMRTY